VTALAEIGQRAELITDLQGIEYLRGQGILTERQAAYMAERAWAVIVIEQLRLDLPGYRIWRHELERHVLYFARATRDHVRPYSIATGDLRELVTELGREIGPYDYPRALTPGAGPHPEPAAHLPAAGGPAPGPFLPLPRGEQLLARIRALSPEDCRQALIFISGAAPALVDQAMAAIITPLSTGVVVRR